MISHHLPFSAVTRQKKNKITASTTLAVFATLDSRRRIEIKLSDINALQSIDKMTMDNIDAARAITIDNWDSQIPTETRKEGIPYRKHLTGDSRQSR